MRFTVIWKPAALDDLMKIWTDFPDRRAGVTQAADEIERAIRRDPGQKGRPYDGDRVLTRWPLAVVYSIDEGDLKVEIIEVHLI